MHSFRRPVKIQFVKLRNSKLAYSRKDTTSSKMSRFYDITPQMFVFCFLLPSNLILIYHKFIRRTGLHEYIFPSKWHICLQSER